MMIMITNFSTWSFLSFGIISIGYVFQSSLLQYIFYNRRNDSISIWKIQADKTHYSGTTATAKSTVPISSIKGNYHNLVTALNLMIASFFAFIITELSVNGKTNLRFDDISSYGLTNITQDFVLAVIFENIVEYYWHRLMHTRYFYHKMHKYHHFYKSPEPFDDMYIHPLEAFGYYCILYAPPILFKCHLYAFLLYMVIMGLCGILDHSGIRVHIKGIYNTCDHDDHHAKFEVNYGFPFIYMDLLHGTYEGDFLGWKFHRNKKIS